MRLTPLITVVGFASQALAAKSIAAQAQAYLDKLVPVTQDVLFNMVTGEAAGADPGVVCAVIPDPEHPDFSLFWVRDAALVYDVWLNELVSLNDVSLRTLMDDVTLALVRTQQVTSLTRDVFNGGLEEPVFYLNLTYITDLAYRPGAPCADNPPFRANILIKYAEWLITQNNGSWVADNLWPAINLDLQWISNHWNESSWDLWWPPVWGGSYWTSSLQYRALRQGSRLGRAIGRHANVAGYDSRASMVLDYMQTFWNEEEGFMTETTVTDPTATYGRTGVGAAPITVSIYNFDIELGCDAATFQPCSDRALSSLKVVGDRFKANFPISKDIPDHKPGFYGFFIEDKFIGGQPQFFSTFNQAEQLYDALATWEKLGGLEITDVSLKFFRQFDPKVKTGKYAKSSGIYRRLTNAIREWADEVLVLLSKHTPDDFILTESIEKNVGGPYGPRGMIRSLAAAMSAADTHNGMIPPSWSGPRNAGNKYANTPDSQVPLGF
ncbi:glycoside hydrolase family 15 protein [Auriscalpium vulgare]|uniref:Glycoside hydrolase family 15 protein n=1 Tax=Auriscalpium vulgare TaxID=40419 RepID=A0ACB8RS51_9AGAM|nr:glycoside hydrolase family 15 protein [Auriscalpium vulgare]